MQNDITLECDGCAYIKLSSINEEKPVSQNRMSFKTEAGYVEIILDVSKNNEVLGIEILNEGQ